MTGVRIDYVLQYRESTDSEESSHAELRKAFEKKLREDGFRVFKASAGKDVYTVLECNEDRLQKQAEKMLLKMPLKARTDCSQYGLAAWLCAGLPSCPTRCRSASEKGFHVSSSFSVARANMFKSYDDQNSTLFGPALRNFLVYNILSEMDISSQLPEPKPNSRRVAKDKILAERGLPFLLSKHVYQRAYPPSNNCIMQCTADAISNDDSRCETPLLSINTTVEVETFNPPSLINLYSNKFTSRIREYFGEEIAFYYAWTSVMMQLLLGLSIVGVLFFLFGFIPISEIATSDSQNGTRSATFNNVTGIFPTPTTSTGSSKTVDFTSAGQSIIDNLYEELLKYISKVFDNLFAWIYGLVLCIWGTVACEAWKRQCAVLAHTWHVEGCNVSETVRPQFSGSVAKDQYADGRLVLKRSSFTYWAKRIVALTVIIIAAGISLVATILCSDFRLFIDNNYCSGNESTKCQAMIVVSVVSNVTFTTIFHWVVSRIARRLTDWENHLTETEHSEALAVKLFALSAINDYVPMYYIAFFQGNSDTFQSWSILAKHMGLKEKLDNSCGHYSTCTPLLAMQLVAVAVLKNPLKILGRHILRLLKSRCKPNSCNAPSGKYSKIYGKQRKTALEEVLCNESEREPFDYWVIQQYQEKVLLFGYVMLFSASVPLVSSLFFCVMAFEHLIETRDLLKKKQRPVTALVQNIGIWKGILEIINIASVITTSFLMASMNGSPFTAATEMGKLRYSLLIMIAMVVVKGAFAGLIPDTPDFVVASQRQERFLAQKELCSCPSPTVNTSAEPPLASAAAAASTESSVHNGDASCSRCCNSANPAARGGSAQLYPSLTELMDPSLASGSQFH